MSTMAQQSSPNQQKTIKAEVFRVSGIPLGATQDELADVLQREFSTREARFCLDTSQTSIMPSCDQKSQTAIVQFLPHSPPALGGDSYYAQFGLDEVTIDKDFYGLTQLYPTKGKIKADIVAVCGLNGHAYGSWARKPDARNCRKMWLRHFLSSDLPECRTMIYGYNSNLKDKSLHTIPDFRDMFLEELKKARSSDEEQHRPILFLGHSFGGIIIAQSIVKAKENDSYYKFLFSSTRATIFFGVPHRGLIVDDILAMIGEDSPRESLIKSLNTGSEQLKPELTRFIDYTSRSDVKIISFKETRQSRKLIKGPDNSWSRSGDFFTAVETDSSILQLPRTLEESLAIDGDHSTLVKFQSKTHTSYTTVFKRLSTLVIGGGAEEIRTGQKQVSSVVKLLAGTTLNTAAGGRSTLGKKQNTQSRKDAIRQLHEAATEGREEEVIALLEKGTEIDVVNSDGDTSLHLAAWNGRLKVVKTLCKRGANCMAIDKDGDTPLHLAAICGNQIIVNTLLEHGASVGARNSDQYTPLHTAATHGRKYAAQILIDHEATINARNTDECTPLHLAAEYGYEEVVKILIDHEATINVRNTDEGTPLHLAARYGHEKVVNMLIDHEATVNLRNTNECTPLHLAAEYGHEEVVKMLIDHEATINARNINECTPLHLAAQYGHEEAVRVLLGNGAKFDVVDEDGDTPLHMAAMGGHKESVEVLLEEGDIHAKNGNESTPLHLAAEYGYADVVKLLIDGGAAVDVQDINQCTPMHLAAKSGHETVVRILVGKKADTKAEDENKATPLHMAAENGNEEVVQVLLNCKAKLRVRDCNNAKPLDLAIANKHSKVAQILRKAEEQRFPPPKSRGQSKGRESPTPRQQSPSSKDQPKTQAKNTLNRSGVQAKLKTYEPEKLHNCPTLTLDNMPYYRAIITFI